MEKLPTGKAVTESLRDALEQDHRDIDNAFKECAQNSVVADRMGLIRAVEELRRHIYAEEELVFPPLRATGMVGPIMVMLREHARMWPLLDGLAERLGGDAGDDAIPTLCHELFILLQQHNPKEEQILYPQVDRVIGQHESLDVRAFLDGGPVPSDWVCQHLQPGQGM